MSARPWFCATCRAQESKPLTNEDVLTMLKGGLDDSTVLMAIQAQSNVFDVSVPALIDLKKQNVSETLIRAMVAAAAGKKSPAPAPAAAAGTSSPAPPAPMKKKPPEFRGFPVDFSAESFATLGASAVPVSEGKLFVGRGRLRFESTSAKDPAAPMIIDPLKPVAYVVAPGKAAEVTTVFQGVRGAPAMTDGISMYLLPADPENPCENWETVECTRMGPETIEGRATTKWDLTHRFAEQTWHSYIWVDVRLHIVSKRQFQENVFQLRDIVEGPQPSGLFDVP